MTRWSLIITVILPNYITLPTLSAASLPLTLMLIWPSLLIHGMKK